MFTRALPPPSLSDAPRVMYAWPFRWRNTRAPTRVAHVSRRLIALNPTSHTPRRAIPCYTFLPKHQCFSALIQDKDAIEANCPLSVSIPEIQRTLTFYTFYRSRKGMCAATEGMIDLRPMTEPMRARRTRCATAQGWTFRCGQCKVLLISPSPSPPASYASKQRLARVPLSSLARAREASR